MCVVSMIGEHYTEKWRQLPVTITVPNAPWQQQPLLLPPSVTRAEFDALKAQVEELVALLRRAKIYDEEHGEPECEIDEKMDVLRKVARLVGVDLDAQIARGEAR